VAARRPRRAKITTYTVVDTRLVKSAGKHLIRGLKSMLGWAAALARDGVAGPDVLAGDSVTGREKAAR